MRAETIAMCIVATLIGAATLSCTRDEDMPERHREAITGNRPLELAATDASANGGAKTRAGEDPAPEYDPLDERYVIFTSAYYTDSEFPADDGDYFVGAVFSHNDEDKWSATPRQYWPMAGHLSFLALATDPASYGLSPEETGNMMTWTARRATDGVRMKITGYDGSSEIMYATAEANAEDAGAVSMLFHHTQACLEFNIKMTDASLNGLLRLEGIDVDAIMTDGVLTVMTYPFAEMSWDTEASESRDISVPGSQGDNDNPLEITDEGITFRLPLLPQRQRLFHIHFRQRANTSSDWKTTSVVMTYDHEETNKSWEIGKKYVYNITLGLNTLDFEPNVVAWDISDVEATL